MPRVRSLRAGASPTIRTRWIVSSSPNIMSEEQAVLEGLISVEAALRSGSRSIERVLVVGGVLDREVARLVREAERKGVPVERTSADVIDGMAQGKTHGGVIALAGARQFS